MSQNNISENLYKHFVIYYACFPLNLSWAKLFSVPVIFTWAFSAVSNPFPAHPYPPGSVTVGHSSVADPWAGSDFVVIPLQSDTAAWARWFRLCEGGGRRRKEQSRGGTKLLCSCRNSFEWIGSPGSRAINDEKTKEQYTLKKNNLVIMCLQ